MKTVPVTLDLTDVPGTIDGATVTLNLGQVNGNLDVPDAFEVNCTGTEPDPTPTEIVSEITGTVSGYGLNGYTMVDRNSVIAAGLVTHMLVTSAVAGDVRPKIVAEDGGYTTLYSNPTLLNHPGGGDAWLPLDQAVQVPDDGLTYRAAVYATGFSTGLSDGTSPRAEKAGDATGSFTATQNQYTTFRLGVRYDGAVEPVVHEFTFDTGVEGWGSWENESASAGVYSSTVVGNDDPNHSAGIGYLSLLAHHDFIGRDFTDAEVFVRVRGVNWQNNEARVGFWIQAQIPDGRWENYFFETTLISDYLEDGQWHDLTFTLPADPAQWTYAGNNGSNGNQYPASPVEGLAYALSNIYNVHLPAVRPTSSGRPSGTIEYDTIRITEAQ